MSERRDLPPLLHRQPPRDYVETGSRPPPALNREQKILLALMVIIAVIGSLLIWLGVK